MAVKIKLFIFLIIGLIIVNARSVKRQRKIKSTILPSINCGCPLSILDIPCSCPIIEPIGCTNGYTQNIILENCGAYASAIKLPKCMTTIDAGIPVPAINLPAIFNVIDIPSCQCQNTNCQCTNVDYCQCQNLICQGCQNMPYQFLIDACGCNACRQPFVDISNPYEITGSLVQIPYLEPAVPPYLLETSMCQPAVKIPNLPCGCQNRCGCQLSVPELPCGCQCKDVAYGCGCQKLGCGCQIPSCGCGMPTCGCQNPCNAMPCSCQMPVPTVCGCGMPACGCQVPSCGCQIPSCGCPLPDCGCPMPCECGCGRYLRQVVLQPPFL